jgi:hypothetical protein
MKMKFTQPCLSRQLTKVGIIDNLFGQNQGLYLARLRHDRPDARSSFC